ncbi:MAG: hypothetical protein JWN51_756 [Phycisphaerales bacterium]|nr:hypothetical protein [Phycisphaerales bacterium]
MIRPCALVGLLLLCGRMAFAGSIFDDDGQDSRPAGTPATNRPAPGAPPQSSQARPPAQRPAPADEIVLSPAPSSQDRRELALIAEYARSAVKEAARAADDYVKSAQQEIEGRLGANLEYQKAKAEMERTRQRLEDLRLVGTPQEKLSASAAYTTAAAKEKRMRDNAVAGSEALKEAKQLVVTLAAANGPAVASAAPAGGSAPSAKGVVDERAKAINQAIAQKSLLEGMTYEEACKAARSAPQLLTTRGAVKVYRWTVKGRTGSHSVAHHDVLGRVHFETIPEFGVVAYVEATFDDGKLIEFQKIDNDSDNINNNRNIPAQP